MAATSSGEAAAEKKGAVEAAAAAPAVDGEAKAETKGPSSAPPAGHVRPVMVHRAVLGSFERFIAILTEHFAGKWPLWLSPRQVMIVPVMSAAEPYCKEVEDLLKARHFHVDTDFGSNTMNKKIRSAQVQQYNFIFGKSGTANYF